MQHSFGALARNFRLTRLRKFRGQQPAVPARDGETGVVSAKCLMSLKVHLLRPGGTSPQGGTLVFSYIRRLGSFFGFKILNFIIFGVFRKMSIFGGMKILWIFVGVIAKLDYI